GIKRLLRRYSESIKYIEQKVDDFPAILFGYSMYEVDGVFYNSKKTPKIQEERTQIIRLMFRPDFTPLVQVYPGTKNRKKISRITKEFLRSPHKRRDFKVGRLLKPLESE